MIDRDIIMATEEVKEELLKEPSIIRFLQLCDAIKNNKELQRIEKQLVAAKKGMTLNMTDDKKYFSYKAKYENLLKQRSENPLIINYGMYKEEVESLLKQIKEILSLD